MRGWRALLLVAAVVGSLLLQAAPSWASETPKGTYTDVSMGSNGHYNQDFFIFPNTEATNYFWSDQFGFNSPVDRVGYMGLQNLSSGKIALATIFGTGTSGTAGAPCRPKDLAGRSAYHSTGRSTITTGCGSGRTPGPRRGDSGLQR